MVQHQHQISGKVVIVSQIPTGYKNENNVQLTDRYLLTRWSKRCRKNLNQKQLPTCNCNFRYFCYSNLFKINTDVILNSFYFAVTYLELHFEGHHSGFPLDLENLENLEKWGYTWKTWKYHGILKNLINIMEKWHETWKNLTATIIHPWLPWNNTKFTKLLK